MSSWYSGFTDFLTGDTGKALTNIAGLGLGAYSAYNQNQAADKQNDLTAQNNMLQMQNYNYNKSLNDRSVAKENLSQENMTDGFNSVFGTAEKKKKLGDYYGTTNFSA